MNQTLSDVLVVIHLLWAVFMIGGFFLAVAGIFIHRLRGWKIIRTAHLLGMIFTASVPLWARYCPLTVWEYSLRGGSPPESFLAAWAQRLLYLDISNEIITAATTLVALGTIILYFVFSPWKTAR